MAFIKRYWFLWVTVAGLWGLGHVFPVGASNVQAAIPVTCANMPALTGDTTSVAGTCGTTTVALNGTNLAGLGTGLLKNTTATGIPSIVALPLSVANGGAVAQGTNVCNTSDLCATGTLTSTQILALTNTSTGGITVVAAQGSNTVIQVDNFSFAMPFNGTAWTSGSNIAIAYNFVGNLNQLAIFSANTIRSSANQYASNVASGLSTNSSNFVNLPVTLNLSAATQFACATTCSSITYFVKYRVLSNIS